jgi:hypothetical protein
VWIGLGLIKDFYWFSNYPEVSFFILLRFFDAVKAKSKQTYHFRCRFFEAIAYFKININYQRREILQILLFIIYHLNAKSWKKKKRPTFFTIVNHGMTVKWTRRKPPIAPKAKHKYDIEGEIKKIVNQQKLFIEDKKINKFPVRPSTSLLIKFLQIKSSY